jgi:hypothetical protein
MGDPVSRKAFKVPFNKPGTQREKAVVLLNPTYKDRSALKDPMKPTGYKVGAFVPGAIIERCGKRYVLEPDGSQRRIPESSPVKEKAAS